MTDSIRLPESFEAVWADVAVDADTWRAKVDTDLKGADFDRALLHTTRDGLTVQPLGHEAAAPTADDPAGLPGVAPFTRGTAARPRPWQVAQEVDVPNVDAAHERLMADLTGLGFDLLWIVAERATRRGVPDAPRGVPLDSVDAVRALLDGVDPTILDVVLESGGDAELGARLLDAGVVSGGLGVDPIGALAADGRLVGSLDAAWDGLAELTRRCLDEQAGVRAALVDTVPFQDAGAPPSIELAAGLAGYVETSRQLAARGLDATALPSQILVRHAIGRDLFLEIAKLRAWRLLVAKVEKASGVGDGAAQRIVARGSTVELSRVDPWVNLLRATTQTLSGALGGADAVVVHPVDRRLGDGDAHARRVALNVQNVLRDEGHLARVADPAGGSWAIERLTAGLARTAWDAFRSIEADGGLAAVLDAGSLQATIARARAARIRDLDRRKETIVGVSVFPNLGEERPAPPWVESTTDVAPSEPADGDAAPDTLVEALPRFHAADRFEALRLTVDGVAAERGARPRVALVNLGQPRDYRARNEFAAGFFSVAGFETVDADLVDGAIALDGSEVACLCSSDAHYPEHVPDAAAVLRAAGARWILLAGRPGDHEAAWRGAGVDDFIYVGSDVHAQLAALVELVGIAVEPAIESAEGEAS